MLTAAGQHIMDHISLFSYTESSVINSTGLITASALSSDVAIKNTKGVYKYLPQNFPIVPFEMLNDNTASSIIKYDITASSSTATGVVIGSGSTQATINDYALESQIRSGFTSSGSVSKITDSSNNIIGKTILLGITNTSNNIITINEIGFVCPCKYTNTPSSSTSLSNSTEWTFLVDRTVLDTPLVIPAGESGTIEYIFEEVSSS